MLVFVGINPWCKRSESTTKEWCVCRLQRIYWPRSVVVSLSVCFWNRLIQDVHQIEDGDTSTVMTARTGLINSGKKRRNAEFDETQCSTGSGLDSRRLFDATRQTLITFCSRPDKKRM